MALPYGRKALTPSEYKDYVYDLVRKSCPPGMKVVFACSNDQETGAFVGGAELDHPTFLLLAAGVSARVYSQFTVEASREVVYEGPYEPDQGDIH